MSYSLETGVSWFWIPFGLLGWLFAMPSIVSFLWESWQNSRMDYKRLEQILALPPPDKETMPQQELAIITLLRVIGRDLNSTWWVHWRNLLLHKMPSLRQRVRRLTKLLQEATEAAEQTRDQWKAERLRNMHDRIRKPFFWARVDRCDIRCLLDEMSTLTGGESLSM